MPTALLVSPCPTGDRLSVLRVNLVACSGLLASRRLWLTCTNFQDAPARPNTSHPAIKAREAQGTIEEPQSPPTQVAAVEVELDLEPLLAEWLAAGPLAAVPLAGQPSCGSQLPE